MSRRCKHAEARPYTRLDEWFYCEDCRQFLKPRETVKGIGDGR